MKDLPNTFFIVALVGPMSLSQKPYTMGLFYCYLMPLEFKAPSSLGELNSCSKSFVAAKWIEAFSDSISCSSNFKNTNVWNAWRSVSTLRLFTTCKWTALVRPHVNKQKYTLFSPGVFTYNAPMNPSQWPQMLFLLWFQHEGGWRIWYQIRPSYHLPICYTSSKQVSNQLPGRRNPVLLS